MECEGVVTKVDPNFVFIELNNQTRVHMSILLSDNRSFRFPKVGTRLSIKNAHKYSSTYIPCGTSQLQGIFTEQFASSWFIDFVRKHQLGVQDLLAIDAVMRLFENNFHDIITGFTINVIRSVLETLLGVLSSPTITAHACLNKHISHLDIISVNSCRHVEIKSDNYSEFPHWSFGVHSKPQKHTLLFGLIMLQSHYGFLMLKDSHYQIVCVIRNATAEELHSIVDSYVLIKNYRVVTEIFKENKVPNLEYVLVDFEDIITVYSALRNQALLYRFDDAPEKLKYEHSLEFRLMKKSMTCIGDSKRPECWLHISTTKQNNTRHGECAFLILPSEYIQISLYLTEGRHYRLCHNSPLKEPANPALTRLYKHRVYEIEDARAFFEPLKKAVALEKLLTVEECKKHVTNSSELVSFTGVLKQKRFADKSPSRTSKRTTVYGFGTPGSKVHQLVFSYTENNTEIYLDCYLNDWENTLMPLGLIPQVRVVVKHVQPQSKKYLKATALTSFEILSYEPSVDFRTTNLFGDFSLDWGPQFYLGHGNRIPYGVIVWGKVLGIQILSVKMTNRCKECKYINERAGSCSQCGGDQKQMEFLSKLHVSDEYGQSKILVKHPEFLKVILDLQDKQFDMWMGAFEEIGQYDFSLFDDEDALNRYPETDREFFKYALTMYLTKFNKCAIVSLDMKCRKLDSNPQKNGGRPLWFCIDARRC